MAMGRKKFNMDPKKVRINVEPGSSFMYRSVVLQVVIIFIVDSAVEYFLDLSLSL